MSSITLPYRVFAVDPATTKSGWSLLVIESLSPLCVRIEAHGQIDGQKLLKFKKDMTSLFDKQYCVLDALQEEYSDLINKHKPDLVVSESAYGFSHMSALIALTLAINVLRRVSARILNKDIFTVAPTISKKAATGHGGADKDDMKKAYLNAEYISNIKLDDISEHEIDSIFHGIAAIRILFVKDLVQVSAKEAKRIKLEKRKNKNKDNG